MAVINFNDIKMQIKGININWNLNYIVDKYIEKYINKKQSTILNFWLDFD